MCEVTRNKLVLFVRMHWSLIQIIFIVETYVRKVSRLKFRRKFRIGIPGYLVPAKSRTTKS